MEFKCPDDDEDDSGHFVWVNASSSEMNCHKPLNRFGMPHEHISMDPVSKCKVNKSQ